jgi:hypothetical protein
MQEKVEEDRTQEYTEDVPKTTGRRLVEGSTHKSKESQVRKEMEPIGCSEAEKTEVAVVQISTSTPSKNEMAKGSKTAKPEITENIVLAVAITIELTKAGS